ncbi:MAG: hypothetical protein PHX08_13275 [Lachnospiraceae bacterium]|nr:hypothetical protein [Lachnospiraceae bacterium]
MSLENRIMEILRNSNGIKAREIAKRLGAEKSDVNSLLYGKLSDKCVCDASYYWRIKKASCKTNPGKTNGDRPCRVGPEYVDRARRYEDIYRSNRKSNNGYGWVTASLIRSGDYNPHGFGYRGGAPQ